SSIAELRRSVMGPMDVRALISPDLDSLLALYADLNPNDVPLPDRGVVEAVWSETLSNPGSRHFGGFDGLVLVAACTINVVPNLTRGCRSYALIENVVTASSHRRRGWGRAVLSAALNFAWSHNCYKIGRASCRERVQVRVIIEPVKKE